MGLNFRFPASICIIRHLLAGWFALCLATSAVALERRAPRVAADEAPRIVALLEQGWAAETGRGLGRNPWLAASLYQQAGEMGSGEGYFQAARLHLALLDRARAVCLLSAASHLGHGEAVAALDRLPAGEPARCPDGPAAADQPPFDLAAYVSGLPATRQKVAQLILRLAPAYQVEPALALAIASAESNFNPLALSPKMAMGVMQLIPATAERFAVRDPYNIEQNIRGGLAYLRWLDGYFAGDRVRVIAAYNAGEGAVRQYGGVPPYPETRNYVRRVMHYAGQGNRPLVRWLP